MDFNETFGFGQPLQSGAPSAEVVAMNPSLTSDVPLDGQGLPPLVDYSTGQVQNEADVSTLSVQQLERHYYLSTFYGEDISVKIVKMLVPSGVNTWASVCNKITSLTIPNLDNTEYVKRIKSMIRLDHVYTLADIIRTISSIRKELGLKPYLKNIIKDCVSDFLSGHIAEAVLSDEVDPKTDKRAVVAYKPVIDLSFNVI